ncbi:hypothetical protein NUW58_g1854 [Xylaria curta]|uniref:Uncharacterized protein n=1 Tax=Xylaria curta TaxID=42375 RepID=A0ACC1PI97_9PEZI|nr:hypothetical protein NUW58_g1854 [Xylaria curta]
MEPHYSEPPRELDELSPPATVGVEPAGGGGMGHNLGNRASQMNTQQERPKSPGRAAVAFVGGDTEAAARAVKEP